MCYVMMLRRKCPTPMGLKTKCKNCSNESFGRLSVHLRDGVCGWTVVDLVFPCSLWPGTLEESQIYDMYIHIYRIIYIYFLRFWFWYITNIFRNDNDWPSSLHHSTSSHVHLWKCIKSCPTRGDTESGMTAAGAQEATRPAITAFVSSGTRTTVDLVKIIENNMPCQNSGNVWKRHLIPHIINMNWYEFHDLSASFSWFQILQVVLHTQAETWRLPGNTQGKASRCWTCLQCLHQQLLVG